MWESPENGPAETSGTARNGETVVFVHGNPGSSSEWDALAPVALETVGSVYAPTMPGFADAPVPPGFQITVDGYARWLGERLHERAIDRAHLVMHDFGGAFGLGWAQAHPERVASLTLIDTGVLPGYRWHRLARLWRTPVLAEVFNALTNRSGFGRTLNRHQPRPLSSSTLDRLYADSTPAARRTAVKLYRATDPGALGHHPDRLRERNPPALVIWGGHDPYLPAAYAERQREAFPSAEVVVLPDSGHWPHHDDPERVVAQLRPFLRKVAHDQ
jgi:pimeloyl-ACP methyl ester carboxylesterase